MVDQGFHELGCNVRIGIGKTVRMVLEYFKRSSYIDKFAGLENDLARGRREKRGRGPDADGKVNA